jgi:uncharacterized protein (DUF1015 family)
MKKTDVKNVLNKENPDNKPPYDIFDIERVEKSLKALADNKTFQELMRILDDD